MTSDDDDPTTESGEVPENIEGESKSGGVTESYVEEITDEETTASIEKPKDDEDEEGGMTLPDVSVAESADVLLDVKEHFDETELYWGRPTDEFLEDRFFDFSYLDGYKEKERYWVNEPYAFVSVVHDEEENKDRYHVVEPHLNEFEEFFRDDILDILRETLMYTDLEEGDDKGERFEERVRELIEEYGQDLEPGSLYKIYYYLERHFLGYGRIDPFLRDRKIEDISCNGVGIPVFIYHREYRDLRSNVDFGTTDELNALIIRLAQKCGKMISTSDPLVDASLPDGSRIQLTLGQDISTRGSNFTIRNFSEDPITPIDLINWNTFSVEQMAYFWTAIENGRSLMFVGGTGSGKTTSMNSVSFFIPPESKVVSIEDTREITLPHDNWIATVTRESYSSGGKGEVSMYDLLQSALRQRPEYLLVGEIRAQRDVALTFFQAMSTGHTSYTTFHADSVKSTIRRLEGEPLKVPREMIESLDIISVQKQVYVEGKRIRRASKIAEITGFGDDGSIEAKDVFEWEPYTDSHDMQAGSSVLNEIRAERGWSEERIQSEVEDRERVLRYMVENGIRDYRDIGSVTNDYYVNKEEVMESIENGTLEAEYE